MSEMIEFRAGSEFHSSYWGKFYVRGLEEWEVREGGQRDRHNFYAELCCRDVPDGVVFTVFSQGGNKHGTDEFNFYVCVTDSTAQENIMGGCYGRGGHCSGAFRIVAHGDGKARAPRLLEWWEKRPAGVPPLRWAQHCAAHIKTRGLKFPPPLEDADATAEIARRVKVSEDVPASREAEQG
jgi:hypothetical protein